MIRFQLMYHEKRILALHYNTSKKIGQLTKTVGNFLCRDAERTFLIKLIQEKDKEDFTILERNYQKQIDELQVEFQQIPKEVSNKVKKEYNSKIISSNKPSKNATLRIQDQLQKLQQNLTDNLVSLRNQVLEVSKVISSEILNHSEDSIVIMNKNLKAQLNSIKKSQEAEIDKFKKESKEKEEAFLNDFEAKKLELETIYQKQINEVKEELINDKCTQKIDFVPMKTQLNELKNQISLGKQKFANLKKEQIDLFHSLSQKYNEIICDLQKLVKNYQKEKEAILEKTKEFSESQTKNLNESQLQNSQLKSEEVIQNLHFQQTKQNFKYELVQTIPQFQNEFFQLQKDFAEKIKAMQTLFTLQITLIKLKKNHQMILENEDSLDLNLSKNKTKSKNDASLVNIDKIIQQYQEEELKKEQECKKIIEQKQKKFQDELKNKSETLENKLTQQKQQVEATFQKHNIGVIPATIIGFQRKYQQYEIELKSLNDSDDPRLKSLDRQIVSLQSARNAAKNLHEKKADSFNQDFYDQIALENDRHLKKLDEIEKYDGKTECQKLTKDLIDIKVDIDKIKKMKSNLEQYRIREAEMIDNARKEKNEAFLLVEEKYQTQIDQNNQKKNDLEKEIQASQFHFNQEIKRLKKDLENAPSKTKQQIQNIKKMGNSVISERKIVHLDKLDKIQVLYMKTRDKVSKQNSAFEEQRQMIKSKNELTLQDTQKEYDEELYKLRTELDGYKGLYEEREYVARKRNFNVKLNSKNLPKLEEFAHDLDNQLTLLTQDLNNIKQKIAESQEGEKGNEGFSQKIVFSPQKNVLKPLQKPFS